MIWFICIQNITPQSFLKRHIQNKHSLPSCHITVHHFCSDCHEIIGTWHKHHTTFHSLARSASLTTSQEIIFCFHFCHTISIKKILHIFWAFTVLQQSHTDSIILNPLISKENVFIFSFFSHFRKSFLLDFVTQVPFQY